jgi:hypothetical protein
MERLDLLQIQYEETRRNLSFPFSLEDRYELRERGRAILAEAQALAETMDIPPPRWFDAED